MSEGTVRFLFSQYSFSVPPRVVPKSWVVCRRDQSTLSMPPPHPVCHTSHGCGSSICSPDTNAVPTPGSRSETLTDSIEGNEIQTGFSTVRSVSIFVTARHREVCLNVMDGNKCHLTALTCSTPFPEALGFTPLSPPPPQDTQIWKEKRP